MLVISVDKQCSANLLPVFSESSCLQTAAPVDLGGGDWLEPVTGALEFDIFGPGTGWDGMVRLLQKGEWGGVFGV